MQSRPESDPTSWSFQAAIHGNASKDGTWPWNQCKHSSWWFLPWHRLYLWYFEQIVRAAVIQGGGSSDWALPYWNYGAGGQDATLPEAFRDPQVNGAPNPLYAADRDPQMNAGTGAIPLAVGDPVQAMSCASFVGSVQSPPAEFGGSPADPSVQFASGVGVVENTPHNQVHVLVGGWMSDPDTAAQDPIFWLHHANIDRIWNEWATGSTPHQNPDDPSWLSQSFKFYDPHGQEASLTCADVLDVVKQLDYEYVVPAAKAAAPAPALAAPAMSSPSSDSGRRPAELVGASDTSVELTGTPVSVSFTIDQRAAQQALSGAGAEQPERVHLSVQEIEGERNPGTVYGIYVNLPHNENAPEVVGEHYAGAISFFGIERARAPRTDEPPHSVTISHDITVLTRNLRAKGEWDGEHVTVSFRPMGLVPPNQQELAHVVPSDARPTDPPITIGRVSIFYS
jgi:tyrosinase